ncbi:MAG: UDP-N-acetylmuramoyl-L-alanyl-D-glutamate--2,6-diaminopimelate ligase [Steroidobacteraceae bacterium]
MNAVAVEPTLSTGSPSLRTLLRGLVAEPLLVQIPDQAITGLSLDSRKVLSGSVFLAVPGLQSHGMDYAIQAVRNGATVVLWQPTAARVALTIPNARCVSIPQLSDLLGVLADRFYAQPSAHLRIAAVTGTNGKSTTAYLLAAAAQYCGIAAGYSGTVGYGRLNALQTATHTTPDVVSMHRQLAELRDTGALAVGMEVSSHALHQARIAAVRIDTAVFTNLSRDHLDYHDTMQAYGDAKAMLFNVPELRHRVVNADDVFGRELASRNSTASITTLYSCDASFNASRLVQAREVRLSEAGLQLQLAGSFGAATLRSALLGRFNAENLLAALAVLLGWDVPMSKAVQALEQAVAPPGRMELLSGGNKRVVIDYAHTPDALQKALQVLKAHCRGQLICVFGCGGDRDPGKRAAMGAIAAAGADQVIVTNDNPRNEDPQQIITAIQAGMGDYPVIIQPDRALAIEQALAMAHADDMVLIAGKGHEDYQLVGTHTHHFSDREVVQACLSGAA